MMSPLSVTLFAGVQLHPEMSRMSLLPIVYVEESDVSKTVPFLLTVVLKSLTNESAVKPGRDASGNTGLLAPAESKKLAQSKLCGWPPTFVTGVATTSPSSWKFRSCTAHAPGMNSSPAPMAMLRHHSNVQRLRRLRGAPITRVITSPPLRSGRRAGAKPFDFA